MSGNFKVETVFEFLDTPRSFTRFSEEEKLGFMDKEGNILIPAQFTDCSISNDNFIIISKLVNGVLLYGLLNTDLEYVVPISLSEISEKYESNYSNTTPYI